MWAPWGFISFGKKASIKMPFLIWKKRQYLILFHFNIYIFYLLKYKFAIFNCEMQSKYKYNQVLTINRKNERENIRGIRKIKINEIKF